MQKKLLFVLAYTCTMTLGLAGCSQDLGNMPGDKQGEISEASKSPVTHTHTTSTGYQKPGAAVQFHHDYDGESDAGEGEAILLGFSEQYDAGVLTVTLEPEDGLQLLSGEATQSFSLVGDERKEMQVTLGAENDGRYYLNIFADVEDGSGNASKRVFGLAFQVGAVAKETATEVEMKEGSRGESLIMLPAEESISQ